MTKPTPEEFNEQLQEENTQLQLELEALKKQLKDCQKDVAELSQLNQEQKESMDNLIQEMQSTIFAPSEDTTDTAPPPAAGGVEKEQQIHSIQVQEDEEMQRLLEVTLSERDTLQAELDQANQEISKMEQAIQEGQLKIETLEKQAESSVAADGEETPAEESVEQEFGEDKDAEIRYLKKQIDSLRLTIKNLAAKSADTSVDPIPKQEPEPKSSEDDSPEKLHHLQQQLVDRENVIAELEKQLGQLSTREPQLQGEDSLKQLQELELELTDTRNKLLEQESRFTQQIEQERKDSLKASSKQKEIIESNQKQMVSLQTTIEKLEAAVNSEKQDSEQYNQDQTEKDMLISQLEQERTKLLQKVELFELQITELNNKLSVSESSDDTLKTLQIEKDTFQRSENQWEQERIKYQTELETSSRKNDNLLQRIKEITSDLETLHEDKKTLEENRLRMQTEKDNLQDALEQREQKLQLFQASSASAEEGTQVSQLKSKIEELTDSISHIKQRAREMKAHYEQKLRTLPQTETPIVELTSGVTVNLNDLKRENAQLRQQIFSLENDQKEYKEQVTQLENQLRSSPQQIGEFQGDSEKDRSFAQTLAHQDLEHKVRELTESVETAKTQMSDQLEKIKRLEWQKQQHDQHRSEAVQHLLKIKSELEAVARRKTREIIEREFYALENFLKKI